MKVAFKGSTSALELPIWEAGVPVAERLRGFIRHFAGMLIGDRPEWHYLLMGRELAQPTQPL